jgi:M6 family metalloprotease-like protein
MILLLGMLSSTAGAVALSDRIIQQMKENGTFDAYIEELRELRAQGRNQPGERPPGSGLALDANAVDTQKILVILVDWADKPYTAGYAAATRDDFDSLLFSDVINPTGSMKEFYYENSYGKYIIDGDVVGWYHNTFEHWEYVSTFSPADLVVWAVSAADPDVNFDDYDNDGDGWVEGVIVVHSGTGREESGNPNEIHSHMASVGTKYVDNVKVGRYTIQPEESRNTTSMSGIGVFCHEWGHILNLPDLYDTDYSSEGVGRWSLMGSGNYNGGSRVPAHMDPWCKKFLGWLNLTNVVMPRIAAEIPAIEHNPVAYRLNKNGIFTSQYWIVENRHNTGFDSELPGYGLLIYHIDDTQNSNNNDWHPKVFVEQADGRYDLQSPGNRGDGGDPWPDVARGRDFHDKTDPGSKYYVGTSSQVGVWNISDRDSVMTADLEVNFTRPWVESGGILLSDDAFGNGNDIPEAGERIQLILALANDWAEATDISVTMTTDDPALDLLVASGGFPTLAMGQVASNSDSPFEFQIPGIYESRIDSFFFDVTANGGEYQISFGAEANVGRPQLLIVDDDGDDPDQLEQYLTWPLYMTRTPSTTWVKAISGSPDMYDLNDYHIVMWLTGDAREWLLTFSDIAAMKGYLDGGGNLFLTGQGLARQINSMDPGFLQEYLKATYRDTTYPFIPLLLATEGPISGGDSSIVIFGTSGASNQTEYNHLLPYGDGIAEWEYPGSVGPDYGGVSYSGDYKSVFFTFGFEAIKSNDSRFTTQERVMAKIMDFFGDIPTDVEDQGSMAINLPYRFNLEQNYPNPFNPVTKISYVITGVGPRIDHTRLEVFNILGQQVRMLVDKDQVPGEYSVDWDGRDEQGREVASGLYFYRLTRGDQNETRKMILLK